MDKTKELENRIIMLEGQIEYLKASLVQTISVVLSVKAGTIIDSGYTSLTDRLNQELNKLKQEIE